MDRFDKVFSGVEKVNEVRMYIGFEYTTPIGGGVEVLSLNSLVKIITKFDRHIFGFIVGYEESTKEGMQDCIIIRNQDNKEVRVGIHDIVSLECEYGARLV